jgi:4-hydroxy-tetrahydrodipicolinate reductase
VALNGASGRLGSRIAMLAEADPRLAIAASHGRANPLILPEDSAVSAVIDVSSDEGARAALATAERAGAAILVGTTGLSSATLEAAARAAKKVPVMIAPNLSRGVAILRRLVRTLADVDASWDFDLVERHHRGKRDAPSGTALMLADLLRERGGEDRLAGRIHSIRAGSIVGEHELRLSAEGEEILVSHRAANRDVFARGAIEATCWLVGQSPGFHAFDDSLDR